MLPFNRLILVDKNITRVLHLEYFIAVCLNC